MPEARHDRAGHVAGYVAALAALTGVVVALASGTPVPEGRDLTAGPLLALVALALLVTAAERAQVRYRVGADVNGINLVEAGIAPLLVAFPTLQAVLAVAAGQALAAVLARNDPLKSAFNVVQWSLATACGSVVVGLVGGRGLTPRTVAGLLLALLVVALVNNTAFTGVLAVSSGGAPREVLRRLAPLLVPAWVAGLLLNAAVGVLYAAAYDGSPVSVVLFVAPLVVLHLAYRGQAEAHAERALVAGLHRSAQALAAPLDPREALGTWLREVAGTFGARAVALVLTGPDGRTEVHRTDGADGSDPLLTTLATLSEPATLTADDSPLLRAAGARDALVAPLPGDGAALGVLVVLDRSGVESAAASALPVATALAREAAATLARGRLLADVLEERRRLDELVTTTSDGILSLDPSGLVQSWNPALERLTGLPEQQVVGREGALAPLRLRTADGIALGLGGWSASGGLDDDLPVELLLDTPDGTRRVTCSYSLARDADGRPRTLVVVARDLTPAQEVAELRAQFSRLVEAEAAQRVVLEHLQRAVMPPLPVLPGAELGVRYVASDPTEPTGGDLYDCQVLPDGTVHLAVVDVVGHGVQATQHALSVAHTLRTVVLDGTPLDDVVERADVLLGRQDPDLVATVVLGRFDPATGALWLAGGGHPPPLVVRADGAVRQVDVEGGPVGWPLAGSRGVQEAVLAPGDALVLYTDGLVEARKDIVAGLEDLSRLAGTLAARPAAEFAQALVDDALRGADRRDDTLALVLRRDPSAGATALGGTGGTTAAAPAQALAPELAVT